jgi:hypothetical protein
MLGRLFARRSCGKQLVRVSSVIVLVFLLGTQASCDHIDGLPWAGIDPNDIVSGCCKESHPGFAIIHDEWGATSCGSPTDIIPNVCTWQRYTDIPVGGLLSVCVGQTVPSGWVKTRDFPTTDCVTDAVFPRNGFEMQRKS